MNSYKSFAVSFPLRSFFGKYPLLFYSIYGLLPKNRMLSVNRNTQLVIEGFPRSANTFAVGVFNKAQSDKLKIAHHMHVPAQIIKAVRCQIPTIVLIRNPKDVVASLVIYDPRISIMQALNCYISFYQTIFPYKNDYIIADFEEVINNYSNIIQRTNCKFGTNFISLTPSDSEVQNIYQQIESIEKIEATRRRKIKGSELNIAKPSSIKIPFKKELMEKFKKTQYSDKINDAEEIYSKYIKYCYS